MKRLMFMISTEGKTPAQIKKESMQAYKKYNKVEAEVKSEIIFIPKMEKPPKKL